MSSIIIRPKNRTEWLEYRKQGIGSSEVATIVGLNPWETPYQLWRRKMGIDSPKQENFAMRAGHYLEDAVSQFWQDATGNEVIKSSAGDWLIRDNNKPYLQVSPDRTYWLPNMAHNSENKGILECKTTQRGWDEDSIPKNYFVQVQYQLGVAGLKHGSLAWLTQGRQFGYKDLDFVPDFYEWLVDEVSRFWVDNIQGGKEPQAATAEDIIIKYNQHTDGKEIEATDAVYNAYSELKTIKQEITQLEERKSEIEDKIKLNFGDAERMSYQGRIIATWKAPKPSNKFDAKAYQKDHPDLVKPYIQSVQGSRRFLVK